MTTDTRRDDNARPRDRRFSVSSNRGAARHRLRYVEAGGASVDTEECTFCQSNPELNWSTDAAGAPAADNERNEKD